MSSLLDRLCYLIVIYWPFGFGCWNPRSLRYRIFFALLPRAGSWAYSDFDIPTPPEESK